ncbi:hypothetical protein ACFL6G_06640 [candidate division KSB1 bacterium]
MKNLLKTVLILMLTFLIPTGALAWQARIDYDKMEKDLRISEDILKRLISDETSREFFHESSVKGVYIDDHGVVFMVPMVNRSYSGERAERARENHQRFQDTLVDFLSTYAGVIKQLTPDNKVTIVATPSNELSTLNYVVASDWVDVVGGSRDDSFVPMPFVMSAKKSDIERSRSGSMTRAQFKNAVTVSKMTNGGEGYVTKELLKDIKIMKTIFEISMEDQFNKRLSSEYIQGTYIKEYGVIFTVNTGSSISVPLPTISVSTDGHAQVIEQVEAMTALQAKVAVASAKETKLKSMEVALKARGAELEERLKARSVPRSDQYYSYARALNDSDDKTTNEEYLQQLLDVFTEAIADYGHTLRGLKPADRVSILYNSRGYRMRVQGNQNLMLSVKFSDIQAFSRGSLNIEQFKDRITARIY